MRAISARYPTLGIALSGFASADDVQKSKAAGFQEHLAKPIDFSLLLSAIDHVSIAQ
jgi:CheY-like chemotaxis protein